MRQLRLLLELRRDDTVLGRGGVAVIVDHEQLGCQGVAAVVPLAFLRIDADLHGAPFAVKECDGTRGQARDCPRARRRPAYFRCTACFVTPSDTAICSHTTPSLRARRTRAASRRSTSRRASRTAANSPRTPSGRGGSWLNVVRMKSIYVDDQLGVNMC